LPASRLCICAKSINERGKLSFSAGFQLKSDCNDAMNGHCRFCSPWGYLNIDHPEPRTSRDAKNGMEYVFETIEILKFVIFSSLMLS